jgi:cell division protease FtsH
MMLGGRVAEQIVFDDYTGGASNDILRATETARKMVTVYGMSDELGTIHFGSSHGSDEVFLGRDFSSTPSYSESTAAKIDAEIKKIVTEAYDLAYSTIEKYRDKLDFITEFLLKYEIMDDEQFALAMTEGATMEQVENLVTEKKRRSEEENKRRAEKLEAERQKALEERHRLERELGLLDDEDENVPQIEDNQEKIIEEIQELEVIEENAPIDNFIIDEIDNENEIKASNNNEEIIEDNTDKNDTQEN